MYVIEKTESTNRLLSERIRNGLDTPHGFSVLAFSQTDGRGRLGRSFASPAGGLYMSTVLDVPVEYVRHITPMAAVAVHSSILAYTGIKTGIKWVNDLYLSGRKVAGILSEYVMGRVVLGIGVNFSVSAFSDELKDKAISLYPDGVPEGKSVTELAGLIETAVISFCRNPGDRSWLEVYRENEILKGKDVRIVVPDGAELLKGRVEGIDQDGCLLIRKADGTVVPVSSGEVSARVI